MIEGVRLGAFFVSRVHTFTHKYILIEDTH